MLLDVIEALAPEYKAIWSRCTVKEFCDQQRHLLIENADVEEAKAWLDEFIKLQTPFTVTNIRRGRSVE